MRAAATRSYASARTNAVDVFAVLDRFVMDLASEAKHGNSLVAQALRLLACSRFGLSENEILELLSRNDRVMSDFRQRFPNSPAVDELPIVLWSRLYYDLKPLLMRRQIDGVDLLTFHHRDLARYVEEKYLSAGAGLQTRESIASYFLEQPNFHANGASSSIGNLRKTSELPFQLIACLADYRSCLEANAPTWTPRPGIEQFATFLRANAVALAARPSLAFQQAANQPEQTLPAWTALQRWDDGSERRPWLCCLTKRRFEYKLALDTGGQRLRCAAVDRRRSMIAAGGEAGDFWIFDIETGTELFHAQIPTVAIRLATLSRHVGLASLGSVDSAVAAFHLRHTVLG